MVVVVVVVSRSLEELSWTYLVIGKALDAVPRRCPLARRGITNASLGSSTRRPVMGERASWQALLDRIEAEPDPAIKANLQMVARHVVAEVAGDLPALMATLVPDPAYRIWGGSESIGPRGGAQVRAHYENLIATGKNRLEYHIERIVADTASVVTEGEFRFAYPGSVISAERTLDGEPVVPEGWYLVAYRCLVVWPIDASGLISGEELYTGEHPRVIKRLGADEMPHLGPASRSVAVESRTA